MSGLVLVRNLCFAFGIVLSIFALLGLVPQNLPWRRIAKSSALAAAVAQTGIGSVDVLRRERGPAAIILPLVGVFALSLWLVFPGNRYVAVAAPALDVGLFIVLVGFALSRALRRDESLEESVQNALDRWLPKTGNAFLARIVAFEIGGFAFVFGGFTRPAPHGMSYHRMNSLLAVVWVVVFAAIPEVFVVELFLGNKPIFWHMIDVIVHLYAVFWFISLYASFRDRPHRIIGGALIVRRGVFDSMTIPLATIDRIELAASMSRSERKSLEKASAYMGMLDSPVIQLFLRRPIARDALFGKTQDVSRVFIAVDDPLAALRSISEAKSRERSAGGET